MGGALQISPITQRFAFSASWWAGHSVVVETKTLAFEREQWRRMLLLLFVFFGLAGGGNVLLGLGGVFSFAHRSQEPRLWPSLI
jgi:hypothetical protein